MSEEERQNASKAFKERFYGNNCSDVPDLYKNEGLVSFNTII